MTDSNFKPYPNYKPFGVEWLGDIPAHWEIRRLRNVIDMRVSNVDKHVKEGEKPIRLCNYVDVYKNDYINQTRRQIALLQEYRTRLIADVVTGKLDVREGAANLPNEADVLEPLDAEREPDRGDHV